MTVVLGFLKRFIPCWLATYILASIFHSQMVLIGLLQIDVSIALNDWIAMTAYDLWGLLPAYGAAIFVAMLIAMLVAHWLSRHQSRVLASALTMMAGALAMLVMLLAMQPVMHITLIAGARTAPGMALQCLAGLVGGLVFLLLREQHQSAE